MQENSTSGQNLATAYVEDTLPDGTTTSVLRPANHGKTWRLEEMDEVCRLYSKCHSISNIALCFSRTRNSILAILSKHGGLRDAPENRQSITTGAVFPKNSDYCRRYTREAEIGQNYLNALAIPEVVVSSQSRGYHFQIQTSQGVPIMEDGSIKITRNTLINDTHIDQLTPESAVRIIRKAQDTIKDLQTIENPPLFVQRRIESLQTQLSEFIELCDQKFVPTDDGK